MEPLKKVGAPRKGDKKRIGFRLSIEQKDIDILGEEMIKEICYEALNKHLTDKNINNERK